MHNRPSSPHNSHFPDNLCEECHFEQPVVFAETGASLCVVSTLVVETVAGMGTVGIAAAVDTGVAADTGCIADTGRAAGVVDTGRAAGVVDVVDVIVVGTVD
jgi:hypothetical protein